MSFIDEHRGRYGVGPICAQVPVAPSTYSEPKRREVRPEHGPARGSRDEWLSGEMGRMGLQGAVRGRRVKTTCTVVHDERPQDRVNREFQVRRPNALWVSDP